jgi:hypothetical protein
MNLTPAQLEQFRTEGWLFLPELFNAGRGGGPAPRGSVDL